MDSTHDMDKARQTYSGFMTLLKYTLPAIAIIVAVVVILIA